MTVKKDDLEFIDNALKGARRDGHDGLEVRRSSRSTRCRSAAKTGSAEVYGKQSTSWVASYTKDYVVVMMVTQGGTGSGTSGPVDPQDLGAPLRHQGHEREALPGRDPGHHAAAQAADVRA